MTANTIYLLCAGGLILGAIGVIIDRLNFPQRRFVAKGVRVSPDIGATRDRTGAHILDLDPDQGNNTLSDDRSPDNESAS